MVLPPSARDMRLQQSSNIKSLKKGGAGESGFCYEAGASVEVAPEEALGSGGWGERRKHQKRSTQGGAAQRCLKRLMWVDPLESRNERAQKTRQMLAEFPWTSAIVSLFWVFLLPFLWRMCGV